jgi:hypothetical protein
VYLSHLTGEGHSLAATSKGRFQGLPSMTTGWSRHVVQTYQASSRHLHHTTSLPWLRQAPRDK